jgi:hypothetical protein
VPLTLLPRTPCCSAGGVLVTAIARGVLVGAIMSLMLCLGDQHRRTKMAHCAILAQWSEVVAA